MLFCNGWTWGYGPIQDIVDYLLTHDFTSYAYMKSMELLSVTDHLKKYPNLPRVRVNWRYADFHCPLLTSIMNMLLVSDSTKNRIGCDYVEYWMSKCILEGNSSNDNESAE